MLTLYPPCLVLLLSICAATVPAAQSLSPIAARVARAIRSREPNWRYDPVVCLCPTVPGQLSRDTGSLVRRAHNGAETSVGIDIYQMESVEIAADWVGSIPRGRLGPRCRVESYWLGDEAYLLHCPSSYRNILYYRKGNFVVELRGNSQNLVERLARASVMGFPAS